MSQLSDVLRQNAELIASLPDNADRLADSDPYTSARAALARARAALVDTAYAWGDPDALAVLTSADRAAHNRPITGGSTTRTGVPVMTQKDSKLVRKAKKAKKALGPKATTADVFGALADDAAADGDPIAREALGIASTADTIAKMRRARGL
jgi:hypothetical protein